MREILVAGDTNRLVAELTFVRINDLAAPPEALDPLFYIEPIVAVLIVVWLNHSDPKWNLFDMFLVLTAVTDVVFQLAGTEQDADMFGASLLRFCRLIRLVRVVTPGAAEKRGRGLLALGHVHAVGWIHSLGHPGIL
eukprot:g3520.t1